MKGSSPAIKPIALLVISILASFTASAVEIYGDENNQVIVGGRLQLHVINTGVVDQIIRLNATAPRLSAALRDFLA
ncbi:hypothetical protein AAEJ42_19150, partial [Shewanella algae]